MVHQDQIQKGFIALAEGVADLSLDVPNAPELLATYVARAVVDEVLPPSIAKRLPTGAEAEYVGG